MATVYWNPNAQFTAQVDTLTVAGTPAAGNVITATINTKNISYTLTGADTAITAAAALQALLANTSITPPEFQEMTWSVSGAVITATAATPGTPFTLTSSATGGGATITHANVTANSSPSDVDNASNWLRSGSPSLPQNGDDVVVADSSVGLLWNLASLSAVTFASFTRWQSFTATIGLPEINPAGYQEYRPTYFQFAGSASPIAVNLGVGLTGGGPSRERYNVGTSQVILNVLAAGGAADDYSVRFLGTNASNVLNVQNVSVGVAMLPGEVATVASATVDGGGSLSLGVGTTFSGKLTANNGTSTLFCASATLDAFNGSQVTVQSTGLTYTTVLASNGSTLTWTSNSTITALTLTTGAVLDKSSDVRPMTITNATIDGDTCQVLDPNSAITWSNPATVKNQVSSGPFTFAGPRTVQIT
jgi:trimeric autotransporter adhesin